MNKQIIILFSILLTICGCVNDKNEKFIFVKGSKFLNKNTNPYVIGETISDFYIGKYEVTQDEWIKIMGNNPSKFIGGNLPVEMVSWYDCIEYCNKRSIKEGLKPYYSIDKNDHDFVNRNSMDSIKWIVEIVPDANGYRLPTEAEWEYAAGGGQKSKSYKYSGNDEIDKVGWYWRNSGDKQLTDSWLWETIEENHCKTHPPGLKKSNELGIYDMSGNVREWCEDWYQDIDLDIGIFRVQRGGGWIGGEHACMTNYRGKFDANGKGPDQGFRICYSAH